MIKHCCFLTFLELSSFVPLSSDVILKSDLSPCTKPNIFLLWGWALNAYLHINELIQNQGRYVCEETIDNYG
jgi:hypothetical protein